MPAIASNIEDLAALSAGPRAIRRAPFLWLGGHGLDGQDKTRASNVSISDFDSRYLCRVLMIIYYHLLLVMSIA